MYVGELDMATQFCEKCKQAHPDRVCDYDDEGECAETVDANETKSGLGDAGQEKEVNGE